MSTLQTRLPWLLASVVLYACALVAGCHTGEREVSTIEKFGGLMIPAGEGPLVNSPPVDAVLFDPAKRVITDDDFAAVYPSIRQLSPRRLDLHGQRVSDRSIMLINELADLRWIDLRDTDVTSDGLRQLRPSHEPQAK
jgi:hypothetical protein